MITLNICYQAPIPHDFKYMLPGTYSQGFKQKYAQNYPRLFSDTYTSKIDPNTSVLMFVSFRIHLNTSRDTKSHIQHIFFWGPGRKFPMISYGFPMISNLRLIFFVCLCLLFMCRSPSTKPAAGAAGGAPCGSPKWNRASPKWVNRVLVTPRGNRGN